ncbi:portal protein [Comamonas thiooxydans]|uniref:portal protein n=1 Tax=Comamonas thiooxydans TaxID=363952 RepID=UPI001CCE6642|nr:hypothetical protein [Comamonas thiooxydans]UBQ44592.1 hypothetical protein LCH15_25915 [Comamonas thiooxydans]
MFQSDIRADRQGAGDRVLHDPADSASTALVDANQVHPLDTDAMVQLHRRIMGWYYTERGIQADNRLEMAIDADFYDGDQWDRERAIELEQRDQLPLVFNECAPMADWMIGTERRSRVDWRVMPRTKDQVEIADLKTKTLKYVSDVNQVPFNRSRAFADAVKVGVGFVDDGVRSDPTKDILYSKYEDWRNVLWDSLAVELDLSDARYIFRSRWTDDDIAVAMFPHRAEAVRRAALAERHWDGAGGEDEFQRAGYTASSVHGGAGYLMSGRGGIGSVPRSRIKLLECQFRMPVTVKMVVDGPFRGSFFNTDDVALMDALGEVGGSIVDRVMMRMHTAVMTETSLLSLGVSPMRHNEFSLTPIWCYRRGRDRMPYGAIRRVRDLQRDLNQRASRALFLMSTNQIFVEEGAVTDINELREEVDRADGVIVHKANKKIEVRRDSEQAAGQVQMMAMNAQAIQKSVGISNENMGRQTNASSGEAIKARQLQGGVVTTEPFDNLRLATQVQGQKQLSLVEQWYTEEKVIRLTGSRGSIDWAVINEPEQQADGSIRYLNDITRSLADFVVAEQDYSGTMRAELFEALNNLAGRMPDNGLALRLLTIAMEFSDLPNNDQIAEEIRKLTGERDPNKPMTPEEAQQMQEQLQAQAEALQMQREQARLALEEQKAKVQEILARADKLAAEAERSRSEGNVGQAQELEGAAAMARQAADKQLETTMRQLSKAQADLANRTLQINTERDTALQVARINADSRERVAEIQAQSRAGFAGIDQRLSHYEGRAAAEGGE